MFRQSSPGAHRHRNSDQTSPWEEQRQRGGGGGKPASVRMGEGKGLRGESMGFSALLLSRATQKSERIRTRGASSSLSSRRRGVFVCLRGGSRQLGGSLIQAHRVIA